MNLIASSAFALLLAVSDKRGVIRYKRIGPVTGELVRDKLVPLLNELDRE